DCVRLRQPSRSALFPYTTLFRSLMVNDSAWEETGGFDEDYFLYWEDVDFALRVDDAGGALRLVESATAVHDEGGTQGGGDPSVRDRKSTRLNSSHVKSSYAVFCL